MTREEKSFWSLMLTSSVIMMGLVWLITPHWFWGMPKVFVPPFSIVALSVWFVGHPTVVSSPKEAVTAKVE